MVTYAQNLKIDEGIDLGRNVIQGWKKTKAKTKTERENKGQEDDSDDKGGGDGDEVEPSDRVMRDYFTEVNAQSDKSSSAQLAYLEINVRYIHTATLSPSFLPL